MKVHFRAMRGGPHDVREHQEKYLIDILPQWLRRKVGELIVHFRQLKAFLARA